MQNAKRLQHDRSEHGWKCRRSGIQDGRPPKLGIYYEEFSSKILFLEYARGTGRARDGPLDRED